MIKQLESLQVSIRQDNSRLVKEFNVDYQDYLIAIGELSRTMHKLSKIKQESVITNPSTITINNELLHSNAVLKQQNAEQQLEIRELTARLTKANSDIDQLQSDLELAAREMIQMKKKVEEENQKANYAELTFINAKAQLSYSIENNMREHQELIERRRQLEKLEDTNKVMRSFFRNSIYSLQSKEKSPNQVQNEYGQLTASIIEGTKHFPNADGQPESLSIFDHSVSNYSLRSKFSLHSQTDLPQNSIVSAFSVNLNQSIFATAGNDYLLNLVSFKDKGIEIVSTIATDDLVKSVDVFDKGSLIAYSYGSAEIHLASTTKAKNMKSIKTKSAVSMISAFSNYELLSFEQSGLVGLWDLYKLTCRSSFDSNDSAVRSVCVSDSKLYMGTDSGSVLLADPREKWCTKILKNTHGSPLQHIEFFDFNYLAFGNGDREIEIADTRMWKIVKYIDLGGEPLKGTGFRFGIGNYKAIVGTSKGMVNIYDLGDHPEMLLSLPLANEEIPFIWYNPTRDDFVAVDQLGTCYFYVSI